MVDFVKFFLAAVLGASVAIMVSTVREEPTSAATVDSRAVTEIGSRVNDRQIERLEDRVENLELRETAPQELTSRPPTDNTPRGSSDVRVRRSTAGSTEDSESPQYGNLEEVGRALQIQFDDESVDADWAAAAEKSIFESTAHPAFHGTKLVDWECRATLCRVEVKHRDAQSKKRFYEQGLLQEPWRNGGLAVDVTETEQKVFLRRPTASAR